MPVRAASDVRRPAARYHRRVSSLIPFVISSGSGSGTSSAMQRRSEMEHLAINSSTAPSFSSNYGIPDFTPKPILSTAASRTSPRKLVISRSSNNLRSSSNLRSSGSSPVRKPRMPSSSSEQRRRDSLALSTSDESSTVRGANASRSTLASSVTAHSPRRLPEDSVAHLLPPSRSAASLPQSRTVREVTFAESVEHAPMPPPFSGGDARLEAKSRLEEGPMRHNRLRDQLALRVSTRTKRRDNVPLTSLCAAQLAHRRYVPRRRARQ
ncbi:hypothetical protein FA09DRAFT_16407 [Tilletiopsis washingtonensis]|jgi:hypothetical protein|uniref:Uncharacterized protein n=1 Tax=Tilletiopsis washingtonensis TaxID=58919 RepID=A0A316Z8G3_9BASI|nr:hypothetical protein FA09DRAFT_16407 [Tilletiopsis washingtonensis]PWN98077.1 hypothetical protein FA09DRAFT_16407 [Tilletiopsis washingtonensis]